MTPPSLSPVILITGASSGIGAATARRFARQGYRTALAARRVERLQALADEIQTAGGQALVLPTDVARLDEIQAMVQRTLEAWGQIDVLFNNAGFGRMDWLEKLDPQEDIAAQVQVNLIGLIQISRAVLPHMIARRQGHIIHMCSVAGLVATPTYSVYAAAKFGVRGFTDALRREVGIHSVRVSGIYPGSVDNEFGLLAHRRRKTRIGTLARLRLTSEQVAEAVWGLARRPRRSLVLPWPMGALAWLAALFPGPADWIMEWVFVRRERQG